MTSEAILILIIWLPFFTVIITELIEKILNSDSIKRRKRK